MSYDYQTQRPQIFTESGQVMFIRIRDKAKELIKAGGAAMAGQMMVGSGDSWMMLACIDRLVELGELVEIPNPVSRAGQHRVFIKIEPL